MESNNIFHERLQSDKLPEEVRHAQLRCVKWRQRGQLDHQSPSVGTDLYHEGNVGWLFIRMYRYVIQSDLLNNCPFGIIII